jgi:hypothetical protein
MGVCLREFFRLAETRFQGRQVGTSSMISFFDSTQPVGTPAQLKCHVVETL